MHDLGRAIFEIDRMVGEAESTEHREFLEVLDELLHGENAPRRARRQERELGGAWGGLARLRAGLTGLGWRARQALQGGERNENTLTNLVFFERHPERGDRLIRADERDLAREWLQIRDTLVRPALGGLAPSPIRPPAPSAPGGTEFRRDSWLKAEWADYAPHRCSPPAQCKDGLMVRMRLLSNDVQVNPKTVGAFTRLAKTLLSTGYQATSTWGYICREVKEGTECSLHAYGLAVDIDGGDIYKSCNPWLPGKTTLVQFSAKRTQSERCQDAMAGRADTTFTEAQIAAVEAIRTVDGLQVFAWGGRWSSLKDTMHFQINVSPAELERGIAPP